MIEESVSPDCKRILFVDNDTLLVPMMQEILQNIGYAVTAMISSTETLALFKQAPNRYDLIITDLTMPDLSGDKLAEEILAIRPEIPIILITGDTDLIDDAMIQQSGIHTVIEKPFLIKYLAKVIKLIFDGTETEKASAESL